MTARTSDAVGIAQVVALYVLGRVGRGEIARSTGREEQYVLLDFARHVGDHPASAVTASDVQAWVDAMDRVARTTRRDRLAIVRRFFASLVEAGAVDRDPTGGIAIVKSREVVLEVRRRGPLPTAPGAVVAEHLVHLQRRGLRESTIEARRHVLNRLGRYLDGRDLFEATSDELVEFIDRHGFGGTAEIRCTEITHLQGFYRWAVLEGTLLADPSLRLVRPKRPQRLPRPMPDADVARALAEAHEAPLAQWLRLAAFCGLRACEIALVRAEEIVEAPGGAMLVVTDGKGGKARTVPLPDEVLDVLSDPALARSGYLFARSDGSSGPITAGQVSKRANRFLRELGITHTLHTLRHFFGTEMYAQTQDLRLVQELLGHASPVVTSLYTKLSIDEHAGAVRALPARWRAQSR